MQARLRLSLINSFSAVHTDEVIICDLSLLHISVASKCSGLSEALLRLSPFCGSAASFRWEQANACERFSTKTDLNDTMSVFFFLYFKG